MFELRGVEFWAVEREQSFASLDLLPRLIDKQALDPPAHTEIDVGKAGLVILDRADRANP